MNYLALPCSRCLSCLLSFNSIIYLCHVSIIFYHISLSSVRDAHRSGYSLIYLTTCPNRCARNLMERVDGRKRRQSSREQCSLLGASFPASSSIDKQALKFGVLGMLCVSINRYVISDDGNGPWPKLYFLLSTTILKSLTSSRQALSSYVALSCVSCFKFVESPFFSLQGVPYSCLLAISPRPVTAIYSQVIGDDIR